MLYIEIVDSMIKSIRSHREYLRNLFYKDYYKVQCDYCHNDLIVSKDECKITLFEPKEMRSDGIIISDRTIQPNEPFLFSSDPGKDTFECKCPECGHYIKLSRREFEKDKINWTGTNGIVIMLDEKESEAYKKFVDKHKHDTTYDDHGFPKIKYNTELRITRTMLGDFTKCVCTECGAEQEITNINNI